MLHQAISLLALGVVLSLSSAARADVPPPDSCTTVGEACDTAGPGYDQPGICTTSTCQRATPDGPMSYECSRCVIASGAGGASAGDGGSTPKPSDSGDGDDGCSVGRGRPTAPTLLVIAGLGLLVVRRKRRG